MSAPHSAADSLDDVPPVSPGVSLFNYALAIAALVILTLPLICIALLIKFDSRGPVFFRQPRLGRQNEIFYIWKFRTMYVDRTDLAGAQLTQRNDPRVTRVGAYLRKWSLDELPQLFNVLAGEMAMVGPRPHPLQAKAGNQLYADVVEDYYQRHAVLPGITGWAQVNGWRGETTRPEQIEQRVKYDLEYIAQRSLWFDLRILVLTVTRVWRNPAF
jgi:polysaccharide biosynthesis protein PslA